MQGAGRPAEFTVSADMDTNALRAAKLLRLAAEFFRGVGQRNASAADAMEANARAYELVADAVERSPTDVALEVEEDSTPKLEEPESEASLRESKTSLPESDERPPESEARPPEREAKLVVVSDQSTSSPEPAMPEAPAAARRPERAHLAPREYFVKCWRSGTSASRAPDYEFLISGRINGNDAAALAKRMAEKLAAEAGREDTFLCRAERGEQYETLKSAADADLATNEDVRIRLIAEK